MVKFAALALASIAVLAFLALAIGAPVPIGEAQLLQPPMRPPLSAWQRSGVETFQVRAADGTPLRGWILREGRAAPWLLMNYGNAGSMPSMLGLARWFAHRLGANVVLWDYRGYGFSGGRTDALAARDDALVLYDAVRARSRRAPFVYGLSYGTTLAVHIAAQRPVRGLILQAPPSDATTAMLAIRDRSVPWPLNRLRPVASRSVRVALDEAREIVNVRAPLLVLHGDADTLIPIAQGRAVERAAASRDKTFVVIRGARHTDVFYAGTPAGAAIATFVRSH